MLIYDLYVRQCVVSQAYDSFFQDDRKSDDQEDDAAGNKNTEEGMNYDNMY